jgi:hypothetical protein
MLIAPIVANMEVRGVNVAFVDCDHSAISRRVLSHLNASKHFMVKQVTVDYLFAYGLLEAAGLMLLYPFRKNSRNL